MMKHDRDSLRPVGGIEPYEQRALNTPMQMTRFFIAYVGRSGSSYLQGLLDSHSRCTCLGEVLWDYEASGSLQPSSEFIDMKVAQADHAVVGFKFGNTHLFRHAPLVEHLQVEGYGAIHLSRRNRLSQYVSMRLAHINDAWRSDYGVWSENRVTVDLEHLETFLNRFEDHDRRISDLLSDFPVHRIWYEDLVQPSGYLSALKFLGLSREPLVSRFHKQGQLALDEAITNLHAVRAYLAERDLEHYLNA